MNEAAIYTLPLAARLAGLEYRTLHSWYAKGLIPSSLRDAGGSGVGAFLSGEDVAMVCLIATLRRIGMPLARVPELRQAMRNYRWARRHNDPHVLAVGSERIVTAPLFRLLGLQDTMLVVDLAPITEVLGAVLAVSVEEEA